jgi:hypothetical protein
MKLIATQTLDSAQPSITFGNIPQNFTDLFINLSLRANSGTTHYLDVELDFNNETASQWRGLYATGTTPGTNSGSFNIAAGMNGNITTANTFSNCQIYVPNYSSTGLKSISSDFMAENNSSTEFLLSVAANAITNSASVTQITIRDAFGSANFAAGSTASLYGIGGVGDGWAPKATGGVISKTGGYYVHTFTASGTFTPTANLTDVEYLVVAGGGGGFIGGGGAGGYRSSVSGESSGGGASAEAKLSLTSGTGYTVTVGAGGTAGVWAGANPTNGANSVFGAITNKFFNFRVRFYLCYNSHDVVF